VPLYDYQCTICGKSCELLQKMGETPAVTCPHCGQEGLKRQVSAPSFQLKGSGWYVTDFKQKDKTVKPETPKENKPEEPAKPAKEKDQ